MSLSDYFSLVRHVVCCACAATCKIYCDSLLEESDNFLVHIPTLLIQSLSWSFRLGKCDLYFIFLHILYTGVPDITRLLYRKRLLVSFFQFFLGSLLHPNREFVSFLIVSSPCLYQISTSRYYTSVFHSSVPPSIANSLMLSFNFLVNAIKM